MFSIPGAFVALANQFVRAIASAAEKKTLLFVDSTVEDRESLIAGVDPTTEVFVLDDRTDGIARITKILTAYKQVEAVHIVSHGSSGCLQLGNGTLDVKTIESYATDINKWRSSLASDADILIYGCCPQYWRNWGR